MKSRFRVALLGALTAALMYGAGVADAAPSASNAPVKIGVLTDLSGIYSTLGGKGSVTAAQMAIDDFGGKVLGKPVELVSADHQNKPDVGSTIARRWIDEDGVNMITGLLNSGVGLAVQRLASEKHTITINTGASATEFTESQCSKYGIHYTYDVHALSVGTATQVMKQGGDSWFFITVNYAFGRSLQNSATEVVERLGGKVLGSVITPLATTDFSSYLTQAQASGAKIIALANTGLDTVNAIKTARAFHIGGKDQKIVALETFIGDIKSIGLENAQGLEFTTAFYWDRNPETRAWSERFFKKTGFMPNQVQAGTYSGVMTYLKAVAAAGTDNADAVRSELGKMKINDFFVHDGTIEPNGLMLHDMYLVKVKQPSESHGPWDILNVVSTINAKDAFIPLSKSQCPLLHSGQN